MKDAREIRDIIATLGDTIDNLGDPSNAPSVEAIQYAERKIGHKLPREYITFLSEFGRGRILGDEIYSIYVPLGESRGIGDLVFKHQLNSQRKWLEIDEVPFLASEESGIFFFKCRPLGSQGDSEESVYQLIDDEKKFVEKSFSDFLCRYVVEDGNIN